MYPVNQRVSDDSASNWIVLLKTQDWNQVAEHLDLTDYPSWRQALQDNHGGEFSTARQVRY